MEDYLTHNYFIIMMSESDQEALWYDVIFIPRCMLLCTHACTRT